MRRAKDVGALGHEVDAAEHDELGLAARRGGTGQLQRVADIVGELDHLIALIVMAENDDAVTERFLCFGNPRIHLIV